MKLLIQIAFLLVFVINVHCQDWATKMDSVLTILAEDEMFHGQILIAEQGQIVFHKAYGFHPEKNSPITTSTPLAVKSITKAFTAAATLKLVQEGKIKLSDDVQSYFPTWPYKDITIRHLLSMTSGLPGFIDQAIKVGDTTQYMTNQDIISLISKKPVSVKSPGHFYDYKNSNYITLAAIIEVASKKSYNDLVSEHIFEPLQLKNTFIKDLSSNEEKVNSNNFYAPYGDGNLYSTAEDLFHFEQSFYSDKILSPTFTDVTFSKSLLSDGSQSIYGLGWWVLDEQPAKEHYILGDGPNIRASIQRFPDTQSTLIYIHNFSGRYWTDVYWVVRNIWNGDSFTMPTKQEVTKYDIDPNLFKKYKGKYLSKSFGLLHITTEDDKLYLRPNPIPGKEQLIPSSDTTFYFSDKSVEWEFFLNEDGSVKGFGFKGKPETMGLKQE